MKKGGAPQEGGPLFAWKKNKKGALGGAWGEKAGNPLFLLLFLGPPTRGPFFFYFQKKNHLILQVFRYGSDFKKKNFS